MTLILSAPRIEIIDVPASVGRIGVHEIVRLCPRQCLLKVEHFKLPFPTPHNLPQIFHLIHDLCDISGAESLRLMAEWDVKESFLVEAHDPIKTGPIEK